MVMPLVTAAPKARGAGASGRADSSRPPAPRSAPVRAARPRPRAVAVSANPTQGLRDGACDRFGSVLKAALAAGAAATLTLSAQAADLSVGARVFNNTCGACHTGGQNIIESEKTLEKESLVEYLDGGFNEAAIIKQRPSKIQANEKAPKRNGGVDIAQVQNGKGAMPAWSGQLSEDEIQSVAAYVFNQADKGLW